MPVQAQAGQRGSRTGERRGRYLGCLHHVGVDEPAGLEAAAVEVDRGGVVEHAALDAVEQLDLHSRRLNLHAAALAGAESGRRVLHPHHLRVEPCRQRCLDHSPAAPHPAPPVIPRAEE